MSASSDYAAATAALDALIAFIGGQLDVAEATVEADFTGTQRDALAQAKHKAEEARQILDDGQHSELVGLSL